MFSRRTVLRRLDNRTVEARSINRTVRELSEHVGGDPTPPQRRVIHSSAILVMRLEAILSRYLSGNGDVECRA